jgi:hypothetical protein
MKLANEHYNGGATDFLDVLSAQQAYLEDSDHLNQAKPKHMLTAVACTGRWADQTRTAVHYQRRAVIGVERERLGYRSPPRLYSAFTDRHAEVHRRA